MMTGPEGDTSARRSFRLLLLVVALFLIASLKDCFRTEPEWGIFTSAEGGFSVQAAGDPDQRTIEEELPEGKAASRYFTFGRMGVQYAVAYFDLPAGQLRRIGADSVLAHARSALARRVQGRLLEEEDIVLEGHPGKGMEIEADDGSLLRAQSYLVGDRLYTLMAGTRGEGKAAATEIRRFFSSFALLDRDDARPGGSGGF
jgi:hypothetical protein